MNPDMSHSDTVGRVANKSPPSTLTCTAQNIALLTHFLRQRFYGISANSLTIYYCKIFKNCSELCSVPKNVPHNLVFERVDFKSLWLRERKGFLIGVVAKSVGVHFISNEFFFIHILNFVVRCH